jgi:hypothetical protein
MENKKLGHPNNIKPAIERLQQRDVAFRDMTSRANCHLHGRCR